MKNKVKEYFIVKAELLLLFAFIILAFCLRFYFFVTYQSPLMRHEQDGLAYMGIARNIMQLKPWQATFYPPFYPLVISLFSVLPVKLETAARIASITMDSLIVVPLFFLVRKLLSSFVAFGVCALWSCFALSFIGSPQPMAFSTYLLFILSGTYFLYCVLYEQGSLPCFFCAGICFALGYLTRPEGITGFASGIIFCVIFVYLERSDNTRLKNGFLLYLVGFLIFAVPYWIYLRSFLGYWTFTGKTAVAIQGVDGSITLNTDTLTVKTADGLSMWLDKFGGISGGIVFILNNAKGFMLTVQSMFPAWIICTTLIGLCFLLIENRYKNRLILIIPLIMTFTVCIANIPKAPGYIYPLFPLFFISFVFGIDRLLCTVTTIFNKLVWFYTLKYKTISGCLTVLIVFYICIMSFNTATVEYNSPRRMMEIELTQKILQEPAEFIKSVSDSSDPVMTRWGVVSYYAERPFIMLPKGDIMEVIDFGRKAGAKFLVIDTMSVGTRRQELMELLNPLYYGIGVNRKYRIQPIKTGVTDGLGGYVIYRYLS